MGLKAINSYVAAGNSALATNRGPSKDLWKGCPALELDHGVKSGFLYWSDFLGTYVQVTGGVVAASTTLPDPWAAFTNATTGSTVASAVSPIDATGAIVLASTTAQEGVHMGLHTAKNTTVPIDALSATNRVWFEGRVKVSGIATTESCLWFGLTKVGRLTTLGTIANLGAAPAAVDGIGFFKATVTAPAAIQTFTSNGTATAVNASAGTFVANTYVKLGFRWDGPANIGTFFVDGVADSTTVNLSTTQFPAGENLGLHIGFMGGVAATAQTATFDWVRLGFERNTAAAG